MKQKCWCGKCRICYNRTAYRKRRAEGLPSWAACYRSAQGWLKNQELKNNWNKTHREFMREVKRRHDEKNRRLYGTNPTTNVVARAKWLDHKASLRRQANG